MLQAIKKIVFVPATLLGSVIGMNTDNQQSHPLCESESHCMSGTCADCEGNKLLNK